MSRRRLVQAGAAGALLPYAKGWLGKSPGRARLPVGFVSHGAPTLALDELKGADLARWSAGFRRPRAVVVISAHWEKTPVTVGTARPTGLIYDFRGFDAALNEVEYRAPGDEALASRIASMLGAARDAGRGWDHGVWVPLVHMYPLEDVPVVQVSLPSRAAGSELFELGRKLAPLRDEGVLVLASGGLVHNLRALQWTGDAPAPGWATAFEEWTRSALSRYDVDALIDMRNQAPDADRAHPTLEHIQPLLVALGAASESDAVTFPVEGFEYGALSRTSVQFG